MKCQDDDNSNVPLGLDFQPGERSEEAGRHPCCF